MAWTYVDVVSVVHDVYWMRAHGSSGPCEWFLTCTGENLYNLKKRQSRVVTCIECVARMLRGNW